MWLHEGAAMHYSDDVSWMARWAADEAQGDIPLEDMVAPFDQGSSDEDAIAIYTQAGIMTDFIRWIGHQSLAEVAHGGAAGGIPPEQLFGWASGMDDRQLEFAWREFVTTRNGNQAMHEWVQTYLSAERQQALGMFHQ